MMVLDKKTNKLVKNHPLNNRPITLSFRYLQNIKIKSYFERLAKKLDMYVFDAKNEYVIYFTK